MGAFVGRNQQLDAYKEAVREALGPQTKIEGKVALQLFFWRNRAEYTTPQARAHRKHEADLTNLQKATEDALQGVLFDNDRDVSVCESYLVEQGPDIAGRIVISVLEAPGPSDTERLIPSDILNTMAQILAPAPVDDNAWPPKS